MGDENLLYENIEGIQHSFKSLRIFISITLKVD